MIPVLLFHVLSTISHCQNTLVYCLLEKCFRTLSTVLGCDICWAFVHLAFTFLSAAVCSFYWFLLSSWTKKTKVKLHFGFVVLLTDPVILNSSFYALCNTLVHSFPKVGIINYVKIIWAMKSLKVTQSRFVSSSTKSLFSVQDSEISLIPGCCNTPSGYSELCQRSVLLLQC